MPRPTGLRAPLLILARAVVIALFVIACAPTGADPGRDCTLGSPGGAVTATVAARSTYELGHGARGAADTRRDARRPPRRACDAARAAPGTSTPSMTPKRSTDLSSCIAMPWLNPRRHKAGGGPAIV